MTRRLEAKVALITGSTSGIGKATALLFAREGARVVVNGRRQALGEEVAQEIRAAGGEASFFQADLSQSAQVRALINFAVTTYGGLDILMNNAWSGKLASVLDTEEPEWDAAMALIVKAVYLGCKYAIPEMIKGGGGVIISTSSVHGFMAGRRCAVYEAAKAGIINLTRSIAVDYGHQGIRANAICPGWIIVERAEEWVQKHPDRIRQAETLYPVGRPGRPIDVANAALFLASDESSFITGHALVVDGGLTIQLQDSVAVAVEEALRAGKW